MLVIDLLDSPPGQLGATSVKDEEEAEAEDEEVATDKTRYVSLIAWAPGECTFQLVEARFAWEIDWSEPSTYENKPLIEFPITIIEVTTQFLL